MGREGGGGFLGMGGSILHQLTQVKAATEVGGDKLGGGWPVLCGDKPFRQACVSHPALQMDMPVLELLRKQPQHCPIVHPHTHTLSMRLPNKQALG